MPETRDIQSLHVHILDDDAQDVFLLELAMGSLESMEIRTSHSTTQEQALTMLAADPADILVVDYRLGERSGIDAIHCIRDAGHSMPVLLATGNGDESVAVNAFRAGAADYIAKSSVTPNAIERAFRNALEKHQLRQSIQEKTERLQTSNDELKRVNAQISSFFHTLSHELKTPLTSLREFLSILQDEIAGPINEQQSEFLNISIESCDLLTVYVNDILDVTRVQTGKMSIEMAQEAIVDIANLAVQRMMPIAERKGVALTLESPAIAPDLLVECDRSRVIQALTNLIGNATKFTPAGGSVEVSIREMQSDGDRPGVCLDVTDTGRGISAEDQTRIFEQLYQVRGDDSSSIEGLGLGLTLCHDLAKVHCGSIKVQSELGLGSTFSFQLPLRQPSSKATSPMAEATISP